VDGFGSRGGDVRSRPAQVDVEVPDMTSPATLSRHGQRLLQVGVALLVLTSLEGFAIPVLASPPLGLAAHRLGALLAVLMLAVGLLWPRLELATRRWS
jgi:hypothetical protein